MEKTKQLKKLKVLNQELAELKLIEWSSHLSEIVRECGFNFYQVRNIVTEQEIEIHKKIRVMTRDKIRFLETELYGIKPRGEIDFEGMEMALMRELMRQGFYNNAGKDFIKIIKRHL